MHQALQYNGKPDMLGRTIGEFGRLFKIRYIESALQILRNHSHTIDNDDISR